MKSYFLKTMGVALLSLSLFHLNACKSDDDDPAPVNPTLSIEIDKTADRSTLQMEADASSKEISIKSNSDWEVTKEGTDNDWISFTPKEGSKNKDVTITVIKNNSENERKATLVFSVKNENLEKKLVVTQLGTPVVNDPVLSVTPEMPAALAINGADIIFTISADEKSWDYTIPTEATWLSMKEKTAGKLTLTAEKNNEIIARNTTITFTLTDDPTTTMDVKVFQRGPTLLDVEFNLDGTAFDLSPMDHTVQNITYDFPFSVSFDANYNRNVVTFSPEENGKNPGVGKASFYRIDYQDNSEFQDKLASGHSFETLVRFDVDYTAGDITYETKFFSTHQGGGTGFLIARSPHNSGDNGITFLPNVPATDGGASNWIWANSQVKPVKDTWYHLVGVWDKDAGKAYLYVNGELKADVEAAGFYRPAGLDKLWVGIGGDPGNKEEIQNTFAGSLTIARIYGNVLTAEDVSYLWSKVQ